MRFTNADVLTAARRSLTAAGAHDRDGWIGLFTPDATVEDPVGSDPHRGHAALGRFYDTFIGPRGIDFEPGTDIVVGTSVIRDVTLEIQMSAALTMRVPTFIRYQLRPDGEEMKVAALSAYWELPAMITQFAGAGLGALPAGVALGRTMFANQGLAGSAGFLKGFRGVGSGGKQLFARFLDGVCDGDEVGLRRTVAGTTVTAGDDATLTPSDLVARLSGGRWDKLIGSGRSVAARVERDGQVCVLIGEIGRGGRRQGPRITRIRLFGDMG